MPFASEKQRRFLHARHPGIAARWEAEAKKGHVAKATDYPEHYRRQRNAALVAGGSMAALGAGSEIVGTLERRGKDPLGFTNPDIWDRDVSPGARTRILRSTAKLHRGQAKLALPGAIGGLGVAALAERRRRVVRSKQGVRKADNERLKAGLLGAAAVPVGAAGIWAGSQAVPILGQATSFAAQDYHNSRRELRENKKVAERHRMKAKELAWNKRVVRTTRRTMAVKGPGTLLAGAGITGAGMMVAHSLRRPKQKGTPMAKSYSDLVLTKAYTATILKPAGAHLHADALRRSFLSRGTNQGNALAVRALRVGQSADRRGALALRRSKRGLDATDARLRSIGKAEPVMGYLLRHSG